MQCSAFVGNGVKNGSCSIKKSVQNLSTIAKKKSQTPKIVAIPINVKIHSKEFVGIHILTEWSCYHTRHLNFNFTETDEKDCCWHRIKKKSPANGRAQKSDWFFFSRSSNQCVFMDVVNVVFLNENCLKGTTAIKTTECKAKIKCWAINLFYECRPFNEFSSNIFYISMYLYMYMCVDFVQEKKRQKLSCRSFGHSCFWASMWYVSSSFFLSIYSTCTGSKSIADVLGVSI